MKFTAYRKTARNRITGGIAAFALALAVLIPCADMDTVAAQEETEAAQEAGTVPVQAVETEMPDADKAGNGLQITPEMVELALAYVDPKNVEKLEENAELFLELWNSEDFQRLMSYQEVYDLSEYLLEKAVEFVKEEPELAGQVLVTMGVDETIVETALQILKIVEAAQSE